MQNIGKVLKEHIERNGLKKVEIAEAVGITPNYLSTIFKMESVDAGMLEKLCRASGLTLSEVFDLPMMSVSKTLSDIQAKTLLGSATVQISESEAFRQLLAEKDRLLAEKDRFLAEKERLIQILLADKKQ